MRQLSAPPLRAFPCRPSFPCESNRTTAMPPRRSARVAAVGEHQPCALASLPHALVLLIFSLLPVDQRLRCLEVCRGWYATLTERSLWTRLDLSATAGLARRATDALLRAAAARAELRTLHLTDSEFITRNALLAVARANADTLTELRMESSGGDFYGDAFASVGVVEAVLGAAPRLYLLAADVHCGNVTEARRLLRSEGAFAAVHVRKMRVSLANADGEAGMLALAADLAVHTCLTNVHLVHAQLGTLAALDVVVDAALALRLPLLTLSYCHVTPASAPALARLISGGALAELYVCNGGQRLLDQPAAAVVADDALRANSTLTSLKLPACSFWEDAAAAALLLDALTAHRSLRTLNLGANSIQDGEQQATALGAALGALVAADAPALHDMHLSGIAFNEAGLLALGLLLNALPLNTHLHTLNLDNIGWTNDFARDRLLPAVRANTSLQNLSVDGGAAGWAFLREAEAVVERRAAAA
jgi:hypothetical protein